MKTSTGNVINAANRFKPKSDDDMIQEIVSQWRANRMALLIGQKKTVFWYGSKYVFERVAKGEWKCVHQDTTTIPASVIDDLGD